jgi:hypothetical protein
MFSFIHSRISVLIFQGNGLKINGNWRWAKIAESVKYWVWEITGVNVIINHHYFPFIPSNFTTHIYHIVIWPYVTFGETVKF